MRKSTLILAALLLNITSLVGQQLTVGADTSGHPIGRPDPSLIDTTLDYEAIFRDFDAFMDSILNPGSYAIVSASAGKGFYNFQDKLANDVRTDTKVSFAPGVGYYHRSGLGLTLSGHAVDDGAALNLFQYAFSPSFDYLKNKAFATGVSYTRFITRDSLAFYTTPIQNEISGYFIYRKGWLRPLVTVSYGWGSRSSFEERVTLIRDLRLRQRGYTFINTRESVSDLSLVTSVRHDFYWLDVLGRRDFVRFSPQLSLTSGTQKFGFNQSSATYATTVRTGSNLLYNSDNLFLDDQLRFQPLSLTLYLRSEYSIGRFFLQPQVALDYYFPAAAGNFNLLYSVQAGILIGRDR
ncbi:MAG: hypothetical protein RJA57_781 [Bacteroidota bacterium]|jgi:hypothetical protein